MDKIENNDKMDISELEEETESSPFLAESTKCQEESCEEDTQSQDEFKTITEKVEDPRILEDNSNLRLRSSGRISNSLQNIDIAIKGSMQSLKETISDKIASGGKLCKDCLRKSIESHMQSLGIADDTEILDNREECNEGTSTDNLDVKEGSAMQGNNGLMKRIHRRTLSDIDWHEITRFAQGDLFDPNSLTAREIKRVIGEGKEDLSLAFKLMHNVGHDLDMMVDETQKCVQCVINKGWEVVSHWELPHWLRDNDFLWNMHRPQLPSFKSCFGSMFRIHTETGNIWTHFLGMILVVFAMLFIYMRPSASLADFPKGWQEILVFAAFFFGAFMCLMFSWLFHTCSCHSKETAKLFSKLDYTGIAFMIMGSFVPAMYYGFYCRYTEKIVYLVGILTLGITCIVVSLWDKFATPRYRPLRAGVFLALGCSAFIPCIHICIAYGFYEGVEQGALGWLLLMGIMYIIGALLYAGRIPERFFPGKCNLLFQSHQIFHVLVVVAAFIHLHGCCQMALYRIRVGKTCPSDNIETLVNSTMSLFNSTMSVVGKSLV